MRLRKGYFRGFPSALRGLCALLGLPLWVATCPAAELLWTVDGGEGTYEVRTHQAVLQERPATSLGAAPSRKEHLQLVTADAASVDLVRPIRPTAVIDELRLATDVFSTREGVRLIVEVVLPHSRDSRTEQARRAFVFGPMISTPGKWQRLELSNLPLEVQRCVRTMQLAVTEPIDARGAYVDRVRLRVRPGRGETTLRLGDVQMRGAVPVHRGDGSPTSAEPGGIRLVSGEALPRSEATAQPPALPRVELRGGVLHVDETPIFPRAIEFAGGPLREARGLGCNVVVLPSVPTRAQEREAEAAELWLVAPPPDLGSLTNAGSMAAFPRVIAWHLGRRLTTLDVEATRQWAALVRRLDPVRTRPLAASVHHDHRALSRILDIVIVERQPPGGAVPLEAFAKQVEAERRLALPGKTVWTWIPTQVPPQVIYQAQCLSRGNLPRMDVRLPGDQVSKLTWVALAHGARGLIFGGLPSAETALPDDPVRLELQLVNRQLDLLAPILVGMGTTRRIAELAPGLHGGVLTSGRTHCVLPWRVEAAGPAVSPVKTAAESSATSSLVVPGVAEPSDAYLLATTGATRLTATREAGGVRIATIPVLPRDFLLLTQDALAAQRLRSAANARGPHLAADEWRLLGLVEAIGTTAVRDYARLRELRLALADPKHEPSQVRGASELRSSPLAWTADWSDLDQYYRLLDRRPLATPNLLPGGDFEGLESTRQAGWRHVQLAHHEPLQQVELIGSDVYSGAFCLRMRSGNAAGETASEVIPASWLASPSLPLQSGDVIRVSGWVRGDVLTEGVEPARAIIEDSLGGEPLSLNIRPTSQWQPFVLYRGTDRHHEWTVRLACSGSGAVLFDRITVQRVPMDTR